MNASPYQRGMELLKANLTSSQLNDFLIYRRFDVVGGVHLLSEHYVPVHELAFRKETQTPYAPICLDQALRRSWARSVVCGRCGRCDMSVGRNMVERRVSVT
jgi:hypothetical protein